MIVWYTGFLCSTVYYLSAIKYAISVIATNRCLLILWLLLFEHDDVLKCIYINENYHDCHILQTFGTNKQAVVYVTVLF